MYKFEKGEKVLIPGHYHPIHCVVEEYDHEGRMIQIKRNNMFAPTTQSCIDVFPEKGYKLIGRIMIIEGSLGKITLEPKGSLQYMSTHHGIAISKYKDRIDPEYIHHYSYAADKFNDKIELYTGIDLVLEKMGKSDGLYLFSFIEQSYLSESNCVCGAAFTTRKDYHLSWCPLGDNKRYDNDPIK